MPRPPLKIDFPELRLEPEALLAAPDPPEFVCRPGRLEVEIGIGKGRFLLAAALARPDARFLGVEWSNEYLRIAETRAARRGLANVRFARVDARALLQRLQDATVTTYYVFYPDPWPKKKHRKRRFLQRDTADQLARTLLSGGMLHVATDHADYWEAIEAVFAGHDGFERLDSFGGDDFPLPPDQPLTNFEEKYRVEGRPRFRASWRRTTAPVRCRRSAPVAIRLPRRPPGEGPDGSGLARRPAG